MSYIFSLGPWVDMASITPLLVAIVFLAGMALLFRNAIFHPGAHLGAGSTVSIVDKLAYADDVQLGDLTADATDPACHHFSCFDVYRCGGHPKKMLVCWASVPFSQNISFQYFA